MSKKERTHGGAEAVMTGAYEALRRSVLSCLLWEREFYEDGVSIAERILTNSRAVSASDMMDLAIEARHTFNIRHAPLLLAASLAHYHKGPLVGETIERVIGRADELGEFLAIYASINKAAPVGHPSQLKPVLSNQVRKGLARAFCKFDEYQLAKYNRAAPVTLRDVMFLVHPEPKNDAQKAVWERLINDELKVPDTWETNLSAGKSKKETFERLLREEKLGYMALLRNLRNMEEADVDRSLINDAILARKGANKMLPYRYIAAAEQAGSFRGVLNKALLSSFQDLDKLKGRTLIVVDVSGSMSAPTSAYSRINRMFAAAALAIILKGMSEDPVVYATAGRDSERIHATKRVPDQDGLDLGEAIFKTPVGGGGIFLTQCMKYLEKKEKTADRIVVITDEQDCSVADMDRPGLAEPFGDRNYLINVASYQNGIGYGRKWTHLDGFSDATVRWILEYEKKPERAA